MKGNSLGQLGGPWGPLLRFFSLSLHGLLTGQDCKRSQACYRVHEEMRPPHSSELVRLSLSARYWGGRHRESLLGAESLYRV